ncbi:MAG: MIP family channel protein [Actinobacteria bacterium]|nr:MIP family channel protein [Actinomycetota bacterium]
MAAAGGSAGEQVAERHLIGAVVAEAVGTFLFVLFGTGTVCAVGTAAGGGGLVTAGDAAIGLAFGFGILIVVYAFGHLSGAHVNPAVTVALAATGRFPWPVVPFYVVAQFAGAILAAFAVWIVFPGPVDHQPLILGATQPGVGDGLALLAEIAITFLLLTVIMATATDERATPPAVGMAVGLTVAAGVFAMLPVSGGSFNPARSLGPMLVAWEFPGWWIYILGPLLGALAGAFLYDRVLRHAEPPTVSGRVEERPKAG